MDTRFFCPVSYGFETRIQLGNLPKTGAGNLYGRHKDGSGALGARVGGR